MHSFTQWLSFIHPLAYNTECFAVRLLWRDETLIAYKKTKSCEFPSLGTCQVSFLRKVGTWEEHFAISYH